MSNILNKIIPLKLDNMHKNLKDILSEETIKNLKEVSRTMFNNFIWFGEAYVKIDRDGKITIPNNTEIEEIKKIN